MRMMNKMYMIRKRPVKVPYAERVQDYNNGDRKISDVAFECDLEEWTDDSNPNI